jgi:ribosomal protein L14E/L6E/L27E
MKPYLETCTLYNLEFNHKINFEKEKSIPKSTIAIKSIADQFTDEEKFIYCFGLPDQESAAKREHGLADEEFNKLFMNSAQTCYGHLFASRKVVKDLLLGEKKNKKYEKKAHAIVELGKVGTIVIVLKGENRGKRAILSKNLSSKYLLLIGLDKEFHLTMTQASTVIMTKKNVLSDKGSKAITEKLSKLSNKDLSIEKLPKTTGEKEFFAQGKTAERVKDSVKKVSDEVRALIEADLKDADLKE